MSNNFYGSQDSSNIKLWAISRKTKTRIHANHATKSCGPFFCPDTMEELIIKKCYNKRDHFAYHGRLSPTYGSSESELHWDCKNEICDSLKESYPSGKWAVERPVPSNLQLRVGKLIPDISGRIPSHDTGPKDKGIPIIIEVQVSTLTISKVLNRINGYNSRKAHILWVVPLKKELGSEPYRPREFERFLHSLYYGRVYYWIKGNGSTVVPVHHDPVHRWVDERTWFEDGEEKTGGGYEHTLKTIFKPNYGKPIDLKDFQPTMRHRYVTDRGNKIIPECRIFFDNQKIWWKQ